MRRYRIGLLLSALSGCIPPPPEGAGQVADGNDVWVWQRLIEGPEGRTVVVYATPPTGDFDAFDHGRAREVSGNGRLFVLDGRAFIGNFEEMTVVRTRLENGTLVDDSPRLSFALSGLSLLPNWSAPLEDGRALFIDSFAGQGMVWNTVTMEREAVHDYSAVVQPPYEAWMENGVVRGDEVYAPIQQTNLLTFEFFEGMQAARVDRRTGELLEVIRDERCVGTRSSFWLDPTDETLYIGGDNYGFAAPFTETGAPPTCVLRIRPGATTFDPDYLLSLPDVLRGHDGRAFTVWRDGYAYASVRDEALVTIDFWDDPLDYGNQTAGRWHEIDLIAGTSRQLDMPPHTMLSSFAHIVQGRLLLQNPDGGLQGRTSIWEVPAPGSDPIERLSYEGMTPVVEALRIDP